MTFGGKSNGRNETHWRWSIVPEPPILENMRALAVAVDVDMG